MERHGRGVRRVCLLLDVEAYSRLSHREQISVQARLRRLVDTVLRGAGVRPSACERQQKGDGELVVMPSGIDESRVVPGLVAGLRDALDADGRAHPDGHRIRIRAALDQSVVHLSAEGYVGTAVVSTERVVNSDTLRRALATYTGALVVAVSGPLYDDVLRHGWGGLAAADFHRATVRNPGKGFTAKVWTWPVPVPAAHRPPTGRSPVLPAIGAAAGGGAALLAEEFIDPGAPAGGHSHGHDHAADHHDLAHTGFFDDMGGIGGTDGPGTHDGLGDPWDPGDAHDGI